MLTRSYLIDITLVALASFTLVCVLGLNDEPETGGQANQHAFAVEIQQPDGRIATYRVNKTSQTVDQLRDDLVRQTIGHRTPNVAWMQWYRETAEFYAASCAEQSESELARDPDTKSAFRTVSTGTKESGVSSSSTGDTTEHLTRWRDFWTQRQSKATTWLTNHERHEQARRAAITASIQITPTRSSLPPASIYAKAATITTLVVLLGLIWRVVCPPRSCRGVVPADTSGIATEGNNAAMCFRESWVRMRQPASVVLRGVAGWTIVLSSLVACVSVVIHSLVS